MFVTAAGMAALPAAPETSTSYEVGVKSQWFDRKLTINLTGYKTTFDGYQTSSSGTDGSGAPVLRSAGKLYTKGIEGDIVLRPTPRLRLSGNFLFSKNEFGDLFISATTNIKGGKPLNAPEAKWGLTGSYDLPVGSWDMNVSSNYTWTGRTLFTNLADANNPNSPWWRPSFGVANASITFTSPEGKYKLGLYVKNLFDERYVAGMRRIRLGRRRRCGGSGPAA
jgi:iron complex outermembrane receptor protein